MVKFNRGSNKMKYEYIENFKKFGFGMFVHFGLYSIKGGGEWLLSTHNISSAEYERLKESFFVSDDWAEKLVSVAKMSGCKYINITCRHHDGFSLYDTKGLSDYDAPDSACGRDLIAELAYECNKNNMPLFFYHTLLDWHNRDYSENFPAYIDYLINSIEILCRNYGKVAGFWFDGMWDKPEADWQEDRIYSTIRRYQPEAVIVNNTGLNALGQTGHAEIDCVTFERGKPFKVNCDKKPIAGEVCESTTDHWGYAFNDINTKSVSELLNILLDCRKAGCNLLLNTGLRADGSLDPLDEQIFLRIGRWIDANDGFIYRTTPSDIQAENADAFTDGEYLYAAVRGVHMALDENVARKYEDKKVRIVTDLKVHSGIWLDSGEEIEVKNNTFAVRPYAYGTSLCIRVAKLKLMQ